MYLNVGAATCRPKTVPDVGVAIYRPKKQGNENGRQIAAPTISTVVGHMKRWVSMQLGQSIWQKSFIDRVIRNEKGYRAVWEYIENNPIKLDTAYDMPDFDNM